MPKFPFEIIEIILADAWRSLTPPKPTTYAITMSRHYQRYRAYALNDLQLVCQDWRAAMHNIVFRFVYILTRGDLALYARLVEWTLWAKTLSIPYHTSSEHDHRELFSKSYITMDLSYYRFNYVATKSVLWSPKVDLGLKFDLTIPVVPDGYSVTVHGETQHAIEGGAQRWLRQCQFARYVTLHQSLQFMESMSAFLPPTVDYLHCTGDYVESFRKGCVAYALQTTPSIIHLTLSTASVQSLKYILPSRAHPNLRCLTLHCRPMGNTSYVQSWCIPSSLTNGLLKRGPGSSSHKMRSITVLGGKKVDESGWQRAMMACQEHNVELRYVVWYD